jgi:predicted transcriptional regulator
MFPQSLLAEIIIPIAEYPSIYHDQDLQDVINIFLDSRGDTLGALKHQDIIVLDSDSELIGHISINDVLKGLEPKLLGTKIDHFEGIQSDSSDISTLWEEPFFKQCGKHMQTKVHEVYLPFEKYARETDSILKVMNTMLSLNNQLLPVKQDNIVIGVITLPDIFAKVVSCCMIPSLDSMNPEKV